MVVAGLAIAAGLTALTPIGGDFEETFGLAALFRLRGAVPPPDAVVIVAIDRAAAAALGLPASTQTWPRGLQARLVDRLTEAGAAVVVFDILFAERSDPANDGEFVRALGRAGNVALLQGWERPVTGTAGGNAQVVIDTAVNPDEAFDAAAAAVASFPLPKFPARVTRAWVFRSGTDAPTLPAVALQLASRDLAAEWSRLLASELDYPQNAQTWTGHGMVQAMTELHRRLRQAPAAVERLGRHLGEFERGKAQRLARLLAAYAGEDSELLDLRGPAGTIRTLNYADLVAEPQRNAQSLQRAVAGKIVLVGADERNDTRQIDAYDTVFSLDNGINLTGVEILATAIADLAEGTVPRAPPAVSDLVVVAVGVLLGLAAASASPLWLAAAALLVPLGVAAAAYYAFTAAHMVIAVATPVAIEVPLGILVAAWWLRAEERRLRLSIDDAVRQYLPEEVARSLAEGPLRASAIPPGETRYAVCLATDVERFTTLSERMAPKQLGELLNEYFRALFEVIKRRGGEVENVTGDGMMCAWSAAHDDKAPRIAATLAAVEMLAAIERFNAAHPAAQLPTRIGLNAGTVLIGAIGGAGHFAATVVGDVANTAARIEALNKHLGTRLLASAEAIRDVAGLITRPLATFVLAGKSQPVDVVEILSSGAADARAMRLAEGFAAAMAAYNAGRFAEAAGELELLKREFPDDGPIAFFLGRARGFQRRPPPPGSDLHVRMSEK